MRSQQKSREHDSVMLPAFYAEKSKKENLQSGGVYGNRQM